jgi:hypothetical protein
VAFARKRGLASEFSYLTGRRLDVTLSQELRLPHWRVTGWYRYREDRMGTLVQATTGQLPGVSQEYVIPFSWVGHAMGATARWTLGERWEASLYGGAEWRHYLGESFLRLHLPDGTEQQAGRRLRRDVRWVLGPAVSVQWGEHLQLSARYDLLVNDSNVDTRLEDPEGACSPVDLSCHRYDYTNGNYSKHLPMLELSASW